MNDKLYKKTYKFNLYSSLALWLIVSYFVLAFQGYSELFVFFKPYLIKVDNWYERLGVIFFLIVAFSISFKQKIGILKQAESEEIKLNELAQDTLRIKFFKKCAKIFDELVEGWIVAFRFLLKEKVIKVSCIILCCAGLFWSLVSPVLFSYIVPVFLTFLISHFVVYGLVYWSFNLSHNYHRYIEFEVKKLTPKKIDEIHELFKKDYSLAVVIEEKLLPMLKQNSFYQVWLYFKNFDLPSGFSSLGITIISNAILVLFIGGKYNPLLLLLRLLNVKILFFLVAPLFKLAKLLLILIKLIINTFYLTLLFTYQIGIIGLSGLFCYLLIPMNGMFWSINFDHTNALLWAINTLIWALSLSAWACIAYSVFYALIPTFEPRMVYSRLKDMMTYYKNSRGKIKNVLYVLCGLSLAVSLWAISYKNQYPQIGYRYIENNLISIKEKYTKEIILLTVEFEKTHKKLIEEIEKEKQWEK